MSLLSRALLSLAAFAAVSVHAAQTIRLVNGTVLIGEVVSEQDGQIRFRADLLGEVMIDAKNIAARGDAAAAAVPPVPTATAAVAPAGPAALGAASQEVTDPKKPVWKRKITAGANYTGATFKQGTLTPGVALPPGTPIPTGASLGLPGRQLMRQISAELTRITPKDTLSLEGKYTYVDVAPLGRQVDNYTATASYLYHLNPTYYAVSRTSYYEDKVRHIDYSAVQVVGIGRLLVNRPMTKLELVPGLVLLQEKKNLPTDGELQVGAGFLQNFSHAFNPTVMLEQRLLYRTIFSHSELTAIDGYIGLKGMLSPKLSFTTGVNYTYDRSLARALLPKAPLPIYANETAQLTITSGFEYNF